MNQVEINELLLAPTESLAVEIKSWLNPVNPVDRVNIARELAIQRVTEAVATAAAFSSQLALKPDDSSITVVTRWSNLKSRPLAS